MSHSHISGIHHITAISADPQQNVDFYAGVLGLRMIKKTINFDAPDTYHLYYGDKIGTPGSVLTFFPWGAGSWKGRGGTGQVTVISFSVPENSMEYWIERLQLADLSIQGPISRFDEQVLSFRDPDGIQLELVGTDANTDQVWSDGPVPSHAAIRGFFGATLAVRNYQNTAKLLTEKLGFKFRQETGNRYRFVNERSSLGSVVDLLELPAGQEGRMGAGAVHHIAWRIPDDPGQLKIQSELSEQGYQVSPVMDRNYFHSIYFREPERILFEIATDSPGFLVDETIDTLGQNLKLPAWYESRRSEIEASLQKIKAPQIPYAITME
ncbi:MAG: ring-cleaving dioxygenase [bacterium]|nr:MAG: ring-cleaving dioxygenase [bacterium]